MRVVERLRRWAGRLRAEVYVLYPDDLIPLGVTLAIKDDPAPVLAERREKARKVTLAALTSFLVARVI